VWRKLLSKAWGAAFYAYPHISHRTGASLAAGVQDHRRFQASHKWPIIKCSVTHRIPAAVISSLGSCPRMVVLEVWVKIGLGTVNQRKLEIGFHAN
jgi:hypothetical protein